tara:strand:- start:591 stop:1010 length:420 start_codon:yes stop_codon:yes gene_type:complete
MSKKYGWYSAKQHDCFKRMHRMNSKKQDFEIHIYCNKDGDEVMVTDVTRSPERPKGNKWDDLVYVGELRYWRYNTTGRPTNYKLSDTGNKDCGKTNQIHFYDEEKSDAVTDSSDKMVKNTKITNEVVGSGLNAVKQLKC